MKITLCGSLRFEKLFREWDELLTLAGHVVYNCAVYPSDHEGNKDWYTPEQKMMLDLVHLAKIEESDAIVVLNQDGYIGESTKREVKWAEIRDVEIYWFKPMDAAGENARNLLP